MEALVLGLGECMRVVVTCSHRTKYAVYSSTEVMVIGTIFHHPGVIGAWRWIWMTELPLDFPTKDEMF